MTAKKAEDYKDRMVEEFNQLRDRTNALEKIIQKYQLNKLEFTLTCPIDLLRDQYKAMKTYMGCLKERAILEDIDLEY